jgi:hypothetical protein
MDSLTPYVLALVPTIGMATLFYFVIKGILEGDRRERLAQARWDKEHEAAAGAPAPATASPNIAEGDRRP